MTGKTAFVFPGQGSQRAGMGKEFYEAWPETAQAFEQLDDQVELDLRELWFEGDETTLRSTNITQPLLFAVGTSICEGIRSRFDIYYDYAAGHSLGHFTALAFAGGLSPNEGIRLLRKRGQAMSNAVNNSASGTMRAVLLADPEIVREACNGIDDVQVAAFNTPTQTVISGLAESVEFAEERIQNQARARFLELDVGAAFHSPLMKDAVGPCRQAISACEFKSTASPVVSDVSAEMYTDSTVPRRDLVRQITSAVDWVGVIRTLRDAGVSRYVEIPPTGELGTMIQRIHSQGDVVSISSPEDAEVAFR